MLKEEIIRHEIIEAASLLFQQYGLHKTTMEDIAKAMGRGKSTLYYYYKSKAEIFDAIIMQEIDEVFKNSKSAIEKVSSAEEKINTYFSVSLKTIKSKVNLYQIVRGEILENLSQVKFLVKKFNTREVLFVREILLLGINNEEFDKSFKDDVDILAYAAVSAFRSLAVDLAIEDKFPDWDGRLNILINIFLKGLRK